MCPKHVLTSVFIYVSIYVSNCVHLPFNDLNMYPFDLIYNLT